MVLSTPLSAMASRSAATSALRCAVVSCARSASRWATAWSYRSEEHTSELQSLMRISYAVFCLKKKNTYIPNYSNFNPTSTLTKQQAHSKPRILLQMLSTHHTQPNEQH